MSEFNVYEVLRSLSIQARASIAIGILWELAQATDPDYSEACGDSSLSNDIPRNDRERFVRLCHKASLEINASGFCDSGKWERWVNY